MMRPRRELSQPLSTSIHLFKSSTSNNLLRLYNDKGDIHAAWPLAAAAAATPATIRQPTTSNFQTTNASLAIQLAVWLACRRASERSNARDYSNKNNNYNNEAPMD